MPYPQAMRERAIAAYLEQGMKKIEVCRIFGIQRRSFDEWLRVYEKKAEPVPKPSIRKGIAIMLKILRLFGSLFRKPRLTRFTTCLPPLNNASGAKFAMRLCAVGCTASDLRIKKRV